MNLTLLIIALVCIVIGAGGGYLLFRYVLTGMLNRQLEEAEKEAQVIKEKKLLEVKEKFLNKKAELERKCSSAASAFCSRKTNSSNVRWSSISAKRT